MRLLFVNDTHPASPLVAGMRLYRFACEMAKRGHEVVLLTGPHPEGNNGEVTPAARMANHDWHEPFVLPAKAFDLPSTTNSNSARLIGRLRSVFRLTTGDGPFPLWLRSARTEWERLGGVFKPDLVWATFGNLSSLLLAKRIAMASGCSWVIDAKDNWTAFISSPVRPLVARRLTSAAALTANSSLHLDRFAEALPRREKCIVYSGVGDEFDDAAQGNAPDHEERTLLLVGGTYRLEILDQYLAAVAEWRRALSPSDRARFRFRYTGVNIEDVDAGIQKHGLSDCSNLTRWVPLDELARLMRSSFCASYLWQPTTFHHKLLELLVASPAVLVFPGEHPESLDLAAASRTRFLVCGTGDDIGNALTRCWGTLQLPAVNPGWRWADFAGTLEQFFKLVLNDGERLHGRRNAM